MQVWRDASSTCCAYDIVDKVTGKRTRPVMTSTQLIRILQDMPPDAKIAIEGDETEAFYVQFVTHTPSNNRITFTSGGCMNENIADDIDKGADWYHYK